MLDIAANPDRDAAAALLEAAQLPVTDLGAMTLDDFFYVGPRKAPIGLIGLELLGRQALLRSLVVSPAQRAGGLGSRLLAHAEAHARTRGVAEVYLLTTTAEAFFLRFGYQCIDRAMAPQAIRATREFSSLCPASSSFMSKSLAS